MLKKSVLGAVLACTIGLLSAQEGSIDPVFDPGTGANAKITDLALQPDGKILIGGEFTSYSGTPRDRIARLDPNGGLDMSFDPGSGANDWVLDVAVQPDGKILIAGIFTSYNGVSRNRIARLNTDGSLDETFIVGGGANADVNVLALQPDGKILIGGAFTVYRGNLRHHVARLNTDGSLDTSFDPGSGPNDFVFDMHMQADGKIVIGGIFTSCQGITRGHVARLSADGSLDAGLDPGTGTNDYVSKLSPRPDGRILMVGPFTSFNGTTRNRIMRLTGTGDLDATFNIGTGADQHVNEVVSQPDGKILIGGVFTGVNGMSCGRFARLDQEGGWDSSFNTGSGANASVLSMAILPDGKILITGSFTSYGGTGRNRIARINGTARTGIRVMLDGPYAGGMMSDALRTLPSFPLTEPFTSMGYSGATYVPGATIPTSVLSVTGNNAIVDWVLVEMRPASSPSTIAASRAVLLQRDGDVVDLDGVSAVGFAGLAAGSYCVAVRPRNHLPVMLSSSTPIVYGDAIASVDFTLPGTQVYDNDARKNVSGVMVLAAGDVTFDATVKYAGSNNDRDPILTRIGGTVPTATVSGYWREDVNMDGVVKYAGSNNDRDRILNSIGGSVPTAMRVATLP